MKFVLFALTHAHRELSMQETFTPQFGPSRPGRGGRTRRKALSIERDDSAFAKMAYVADQALHDLLDDMERLAKQRKPAISP